MSPERLVKCSPERSLIIVMVYGWLEKPLPETVASQITEQVPYEFAIRKTASALRTSCGLPVIWAQSIEGASPHRITSTLCQFQNRWAFWDLPR